MFAARGTNTWLFRALAATECAVPAGCGLGWEAGTAGTLSVGTSWSSFCRSASITPRTAAPWAVSVGAVAADPSGARAGVMALGARGLPDDAV